MAERDFVEKLHKTGFEDVVIRNRRPWGVDECALYPLFDDDLIHLMRRLIPPERQGRIADSIVVTARRA